MHPFLAISAEIAYNISKAESTWELPRLFWEAAMLDDDAYLRWLDQCGFSDPARTLLTDIRRSPPAPTSAGEAKPVRTRRTNTRPGTRKPKRDAVSDSAGASTQQT